MNAKLIKFSNTYVYNYNTTIIISDNICLPSSEELRLDDIQVYFKVAPVCKGIANIVKHSYKCKFQGKGVANLYSCKDEFAMVANSVDEIRIRFATLAN